VITLTVWRFDGPQAAEEALPRLVGLAAEGLLDVDDAALASWPTGRRKPSTRTVGTLTGPGRLWGGFWGMVLALIFLTPLAGPTFGAAAGAVAGSLSDFGVGDDFVKRVRDAVTPGTSALFAVCSSDATAALAAHLRGVAADVVRTELSPAQEQHLRDALGEESAGRAL